MIIVQNGRKTFLRKRRGSLYTSLGEAYMKAGQKDLAITNYEKAWQLDPKNKTAPEALKKLKENK